MDKMKMETANKTLENLAKLKEMFPEVITESKDENGEIVAAVDAKKLEQLLSTKVIEGDECYDFTWVGKKQAMVEACKPIRKTLRPCREESVDWENTQNLYIEGDNLDVLKLLQESYLNKVKMIYIDPPYNTGNDSFIYPDDYSTNKELYDEEVGAIDESGYRMFKNTETNGRFHSSWCSMMYPRLKLARNLLTDDGVIFISIDDHEVDNMKKICDEVFGKTNFKVIFPRVTKKGGKSSEATAKNHDYVMMYTKNKDNADIIGISHNDEGFCNKDDFFEERGYFKVNQTLDYDTLGYVYSLDYPIEINGVEYFAGSVSRQEYEERKKEKPVNGYRWRWSKELFEFGYKNDFIIVKGKRIYTKTYQNVKIENINGKYEIISINRTKPLSTLEFTDNKYSNDNATKDIAEILGKGFFDYTKPVKLVNQLQKIVNTKQFTILDFFSGSATTAHAVMQLNAEDGGKRKFIMVQLPEVCDEKSEAYKAGYKNICEIGKERIRRAGKKIVEETGKKDLDIGFRVLKLDESNMKDVYFTPEEYKQTDLVDMVSNIKEDRTPEDLLYACMLEWGLELSLPHKVENIAGYNVHIVNDGDLIACFDNRISEEAIKQIAEMKPLRAVFRDSSFATDAARVNVGEIFKLKSPNTTIKVL
ncbi:MAG: site-specific DNA-methyltransferase [Azospirillum sp.]|nr:site-specific DNA-methyltransferase [Azospirillum sp.]